MRGLSLRGRLAGLIGLLLVICGAALLAISYALVRANLNTPLPAGSPAVRVHSQGGLVQPPRVSSRGDSSAGHVGPAITRFRDATQAALAKRTLDQLVAQYLAVLAGVVLVAVAVGWLLAGRLLASLRRIAAVAGRISGNNLGERIHLRGPRDELRELADTLDGMLARLDLVFSAHRRFIADASHELRTPLAAMRAEIEVLAADPDAAAADVEASTTVLRRQLGRSEELIDALLALARTQPELLDWENVDLADVAREALEHMATTAAKRPVHIKSTLDRANIHADRRLIALLVTNLLHNGIKHNREDGWLVICTVADPDRAVLKVANSGPTVRADELAELTQPFRRGGRARTGDGHGLGLAIVAAVTSAHRGELTIQTPTDGGLRIEVSLPTSASEKAHNGSGTTERLLARERSN